MAGKRDQEDSDVFDEAEYSDDPLPSVSKLLSQYSQKPRGGGARQFAGVDVVKRCKNNQLFSTAAISIYD